MRRRSVHHKHTPEWLEMLGAIAVELEHAGRWSPDREWAVRFSRAQGTTAGHHGGPELVLRAWAAERGYQVSETLEVVDSSWRPKPSPPPQGVQGVLPLD